MSIRSIIKGHKKHVDKSMEKEYEKESLEDTWSRSDYYYDDEESSCSIESDGVTCVTTDSLKGSLAYKVCDSMSGSSLAMYARISSSLAEALTEEEFGAPKNSLYSPRGKYTDVSQIEYPVMCKRDIFVQSTAPPTRKLGKKKSIYQISHDKIRTNSGTFDMEKKHKNGEERDDSTSESPTRFDVNENKDNDRHESPTLGNEYDKQTDDIFLPNNRKNRIREFGRPPRYLSGATSPDASSVSSISLDTEIDNHRHKSSYRSKRILEGIAEMGESFGSINISFESGDHDGEYSEV